ncbi:MAG: membrane protein insertase YidC [Planctomycetota bacterium]|jgi:YidC/Oxa1 family membrane protein insertase
MRLLVCLLLIVGWASAQEPALPAPEVAAPEVEAPVAYPHWTIRNAVAEAEVSAFRGSLYQLRLLDVHPIRVPEWRGGQGADTDTEAALAVLDVFNPQVFDFATTAHGYVVRMGLDQTPTEGAWQLVEHDDSSVTLAATAADGRYRYQVTYRMDEVRPTVHTSFVTVNISDDAQAVAPQLIAINGIHQDDPRNERYDMSLVASFGGSADGSGATFEKWGLPGHGEPLPLFHPDREGQLIAADNLRYVGLKSRFFTALWHPGTLAITDGSAPVAVAPEASEVDLMAGTSAAPKPASGSYFIQLNALGFDQEAGNEDSGHHAWIAAAFSPGAGGSSFTLAPGHQLELGWSTTAAAMIDQHLSLLTAAEQRVKYTDGFYNFFKILVRIMGGILDMLVLVVQSYGVAVILTVVLIKGALHKLNVKQQKSMANMQRVAPKMKAIQEQYKHDRATMQKKMMELYRSENFNPAAGCLPLLIQMPIFFAMFQTFRHYAPMREHSFLWVDDLTMPDQLLHLGFSLPWFGPMTLNALPLLYIVIMGFSTFTNKMPDDASEQQQQMAKMMRWLPFVFGVICYNMPAGLLLYMCCSALIGTIEMRYIRKKYGVTGVNMGA